MGSRYFSRRIFHKKHKPRYGRDRLKRPKTFKTNEAAKKWADANKIKKYKLVDLKEGKSDCKFKVVAER